MRSVDDLTAAARIRDAAIDQFGRHGFGVGVRAIATAAGVSPGLVNHHFGSKEGLRAACDNYVIETVRAAKSETMQTHDPAAWLAAVAEIEEFAPLTAYLVRSLQSGGDLARAMWRQVIDNAEQYLDEGVRSGTIKPSPDPKARAKFLSMAGGGGFLLYIQLHDDPTDLRRVLHDYAQDMMLPALELYSNGLLADSSMYEAFLARREQGLPIPTRPEEL
ncbi:TetR/AcrR family transcriptional regulator [Mycolicibacterium brumae]|uniref:TetR/AcrR family transcriptional regulator n=1 Tax=Mycolicibacterium brumae TaxID=85968 RepID=A0A2G5PEE4_9MYCO|nr:TetR family transcriptional regulator [Mycolicibacterium brumae]MCV7192103.1 TetR/AcrR family transcriptional regulator [Mycolicibacterium brumae]PIB76705.1 TetR/AcrR family transcriptional regulator [Mycolicibacterium brumae]RWA20768.1 TetR family transcriptional regulator [Mycolicibacterium brumae DSM 44177]UWW07867.1 TetR family transcriptional regulator [Mycolicibacterium brumae]